MKLNLILAKSFQFITFVIFTFMVLVYFGVLLVLPLDIMAQLIRLLVGIGLPVVLSAGAGIAAIGYIGYSVWKMPDLYMLVYTIGRDLIEFGHTQIKRFDPLIAQAKGEMEGDQSPA